MKNLNKSKLLLIISLFAIFSFVAVAYEISETSTSNANTNYQQQYNMTVGVSTNQKIDFGDIREYVDYNVYTGSLPPGISIVRGEKIGNFSGYYFYFQGTPTIAGTFNFGVDFRYSITPSDETAYTLYQYTIFVQNPAPVYFAVTLNANGGLINGSTTSTQSVIQGGHPDLPNATFSNGSQIFLGWAKTATASTPDVTTSIVINGAVTFYAVWQQALATSSSWSATITQAQPFSHTFTTSPTSATISLSSSPAGWGVTMTGKTLSGTVPDGIAPGNYFITLRVASTGFATTTTSVQITVPVYLVPPIDKQQAVGSTFSYEPITNPGNANVTINSVRLNGTLLTNSGFYVQNRMISGPLNSVGTYEITFSISASGYTSTTAVTRVSVFDAPAVVDPAAISSITANQRPGEPRTWDFTAVNPINYASITWSVNGGSIFQTASTTSIFTFPTSGVYTVTCSLVGFDGSTASAQKTISVLDTYHPELAWVGVHYAVLIQGTPTVNLLDAIWLSSSTQSVDGVTYTIIQGTPTSAHVGSQYSYAVGTTTTYVKVFAAETIAPVPSFDAVLSTNGMTVTSTWTGSNASIVYYSYGDGSPQTTSTTHTYSLAGPYTIVATGVNNIGERSESQLMLVGGYGDDIPSTHVLDLTDVTYKQGETAYIPVTIDTGDVLTLLGTATKFLTVSGNIISGDTSGVDLGTYDLTVTLTPADSSPPVTKTITVTIIDAHTTSDNSKLILIIAIILVILIIIGILYFIKKNKKNKKKSRKIRKKRVRSEKMNKFKNNKKLLAVIALAIAAISIVGVMQLQSDDSAAAPPGQFIPPNNYIAVTDAADLALVGSTGSSGDYPLNGYYLQTDDIVLSGEWTPIGDASGAGAFTGTYNGGGFEITGLQITHDHNGEDGLFGRTDKGAIIVDTTVRGNIDIDTPTFAGGLIGVADNTKVYTSFTDVYIDLPYHESTAAGGFAGESFNSQWFNCISMGNTLAMNDSSFYFAGAGGIAGAGYNSRIINCLALGIVTGDLYAGGMVGHSDIDVIVNSFYVQDSVRDGTGIVNQITGFGTPIVDGTSVPAREPGQQSGAKTLDELLADYTDIINGDSIYYTGKTTNSGGVFDGYDFNKIWITDPSFNGGFPLPFWSRNVIDLIATIDDVDISISGLDVDIFGVIDSTMTVSIDWGDGTTSDGVMDAGGSPIFTASHTYEQAGTYDIVITATNQFGNDTYDETITISDDTGGTNTTGGDVAIALEDLTDMQVHQGTIATVLIKLADGDVLSVDGPAADFVTVDGNKLVIDATDIDLGDYELDVTITPESGSPETVTITVSVIAPDTICSELLEYWYVVAIFVILIIAAALVISSRKGKKKKAKRYKKRR